MKKLTIENQDYRAFAITSLMLIITIAIGFYCVAIYNIFNPPQPYFMTYCCHGEYESVEQNDNGTVSNEYSKEALSSPVRADSEL